MGSNNTKMKEEVTALKAQIVYMERKHSHIVTAAVKKIADQLALERERAVEEEKARADQLEEEKSIAQLQNQLLTEMVAAEQVNVKLQERRNEALKWELLRQGVCQEKFDDIAKEVPVLADALRADTADVAHGTTKHDMAEAIDHVVCGIGDVKEDLQEAFLARDTGRTGALGGVAFKDALKECFPDMPREDRQLLMLRFVREVDQSVDYGEFIEFCSHKAQSRERLKMGLTGALATTRSAGKSDTNPQARAGSLASTMPVRGNPGQVVTKPFFATALMLSRSDNPATPDGGSPSVRGWAASGSRRGTGRTDSIFTQGTVDQSMEAAVNEKVRALIARRGLELEVLLQKRDPELSGDVPVKAFSESLRAWISESGGGGSGVGSHASGRTHEGRGEELTHAERKILYRRWAVRGRVKYVDFLLASGHYNQPPPTFPEAFTAAAAPPATAAVIADTPKRICSTGKRNSGSISFGEKTLANEGHREEGEEEKKLLARAWVVLMHLSEVLQEDGEEAFFSAFEAQDTDNHRFLDEDGFIDAIGTLAPEVTAEQALDVFRARSRIEEGEDKADYDKLFQDLRRLAQYRGFQSGDAVELRVETRSGGMNWVPAKVLSKDEDGTYTVRFRSPAKVPGGTGVRKKESGVPESDMRAEPPQRETSKARWFVNAGGSWWGGGRRSVKEGAKKGKEGVVPILARLRALFFGNGGNGGANLTTGEARKTSMAKPTFKSKSSGRRTIEVGTRRRSGRGANYPDSDSDYSSNRSSSGNSACSTEPERTPRYLSQVSADSSKPRRRSHGERGGKTSGGSSSVSEGDDSIITGRGDYWSEESERRGGGGKGFARSPPRSRSPSISRSPPPSTSSPSPSPTTRRRSGKGDSSSAGGGRRIMELPIIKEGMSTAMSNNQTSPPRRFSRSRRAPSSGGRKGSNSGNGERRYSGGLKPLETLERGNLEDKFDLYKKRTKKALSPNKRGLGTAVGGRGGGRRASASTSTSRRRSSAAPTASDLSP